MGSCHACMYLLFVLFCLYGNNFARTFFVPSRQSGIPVCSTTGSRLKRDNFYHYKHAIFIIIINIPILCWLCKLSRVKSSQWKHSHINPRSKVSRPGKHPVLHQHIIHCIQYKQLLTIWTWKYSSIVTVHKKTFRSKYTVYQIIDYSWRLLFSLTFRPGRKLYPLLKNSTVWWMNSSNKIARKMILIPLNWMQSMKRMSYDGVMIMNKLVCNHN